MPPPGSQYESMVTSGTLRVPFAAPVVYIASPIDRARDGLVHPLVEYRDDSRVELFRLGFVIFDPNGAWAVPESVRDMTRPLPSAIGLVDMAAIDSADALFAILPDMPPTIGVPMEIERAIAKDIPVVVVGNSAALRSPLLVDRVPVFPLDKIGEAAKHLMDLVMSKHLRPQPQKPCLKVVGEGRMPTRAYADDCGLDLYTFIPPEDESGLIRIAPGEFVDVDCGISVELPPGHWGFITGRSSAIRGARLLVVNGIIDTGYRGRLFMPVLNVGKVQRFLDRGERIGQLIIMPNATLGVEIRPVDFLSKSERGEAGRGSTGK